MNMSRKISLFYNMEKRFKFYPRLVNYKGKGQHSGTITRRELAPTPCKKMIFKQSTNTLLANSINTCQKRVVGIGGGGGVRHCWGEASQM